jgi:hypothetical protein
MGDLTWVDLRCRCGADHVMALSPGVDSGRTIDLFDGPAIRERAWCLSCWRAAFVSDKAAAVVGAVPT